MIGLLIINLIIYLKISINDIYYANICKHEHEKNMTRLWCKIMFKINVEQTEEMRGPTSIYTPLRT